MSYNYWESFVKDWSKKKVSSVWTNPDCLPLYNNPTKKDLTSLYIPEPWWGNDGTKPLHSVVINFNPGEGGPCQERGVIPYNGSYANDIVNNPNVLPCTRKWHDNKRAKPILDALYNLGYIKVGYGLENHLSIELLPWHTVSADDNYKQYLFNNITMVLDNVICFAANESRRIANQKLKNVVIMRMNGGRAKSVFEEMRKRIPNFQYKSQKPHVSTYGNGRYMEFQIHSHGLNDIRFICIWGPKSRNNFPPKSALEDILRLI